MHISSIRLVNFKNFVDVSVDFGEFNVIIGANASGKSNLVTVIKFLKDAATHGIDNAISIQGGFSYIRTIGHDAHSDVVIGVTLRDGGTIGFLDPDFDVRVDTISYQLLLGTGGDEQDYSVSERAEVRCVILEHRSVDNEDAPAKELAEGTVVVKNDHGHIEYEVPEEFKTRIDGRELINPIFQEAIFEDLGRRKFSILEATVFISPLLIPFIEFLRNTATFDIDSHTCKRTASATGMAELEADGSNLAIRLKQIMSDSRQKSRLISIIRDVLPFIRNISVENLPDGTLLTMMEESYFDGQTLPSFLLSDGTITITALIVALFFERKDVLFFEEPERNIHPALMKNVVRLMQDVADRTHRQIIVTTHNPEFVRYTPLENLLLVHRDEKGYSVVERPSDSEDVHTFLEEDLGIEDLYVQGLLE